MTSRAFLVVRSPVDSSCISSIGYAREHEVLDVEFIGGDVYRYLDVPHETYAALLAAGSVGAFFNRAIKNRFNYTRTHGAKEMTQ